MSLAMSTSRIRLMFVGVAAFQVIFGVTVAVAIAPWSLMVDAQRDLQAAADLQAGRFGIDHGYLYTPLAALLTVPATWLPPALGGIAWIGARVAVLVEGARRSTVGLARVDRVLAGAAALAFLPTLQDLMLGNVSILLAAAVAVVAWSSDRMRVGIPLGLALATVPKPALIPILVWMVVYRRRSLAGSAIAAAGATLVGFAVTGVGSYLAWFEVLRHPLYFAGSQAGNLALVGLLPPAVALPMSLLAVAGGIVSLRRGEVPGLLGAIAVGLLVAPYTIAYGAVFLLLAVRPLSAVLPPVGVAVLAIAAPVLVIVLLPSLAALLLVIAVIVPPGRWHTLQQGSGPVGSLRTRTHHPPDAPDWTWA